MKRLVYIFFIIVVGNPQVALSQLCAIQKSDDIVLWRVNLKSYRQQLEGITLVDLKLTNDYKISNNSDVLLKFNTNDLLLEIIKNRITLNNT